MSYHCSGPSKNFEPNWNQFLYGICHAGNNARSSNMAQKGLTWSNSQLNNSRCNFHVPCPEFHVYFSSFTCIRVRIRFRYKRCDICVDLHMIYNYMLRIAVLGRIRGWFYYVFIRGKDKNAVKTINQ